MSRNSWILFGMIAIVLVALLLVALLIFIPQSEPITIDIYEDGELISKPDYSYTQSKDISSEPEKDTYSITYEDVREGKVNKIYKQGNKDPFASVESEDGASNNQSNGSTSGNNTVNPYSAEDK